MSDESAKLLDTLFDRIQAVEAADLEFKASGGGLPKDLWPTLSAFANTNGGWVVLGVAEHEDGAPSVHGVKDPKALEKQLFDQLRSKDKISFPVCGSADVSLEDVSGKTLLLIRVPAVSRRDRPVYVNGHPYNGTYLRRGTGDYRCSKQEVDRMMREASEVAVDSSVLSNFGLRDIDEGSLSRYRRRLRARDPQSPWNDYDDDAFLRAIGAMALDYESGVAGLSVAGLLMLGSSEAIRRWRPRHLIDYRFVPSRQAGVDWDDRLDWGGNLLGGFDAVYERLSSRIARPFRLAGETRTEAGPSQVALREALVNLLVHADYSESQASLILQGREGILFRNPGSSRVAEVDLLSGDRSDPRNPTLVRMFRLIGLAEEAGTGIPRIRRAWKELGFRLPEIDVGTERYEFSIDLRQIHLHADDDLAWLASFDRPLVEAEQLALVIARNEDSVDNRTLCQASGIHPSDATKTLVRLRDDGLLEMRGDRRSANYVLSSKARSETPTDQDGDPNLQDRPTDILVSRLILDGIPAALALRLAGMTEDLRGARRVNPTQLEDAIISLCRATELPNRAIALLTGRVDAYVQQVVSKLVKAGRLEMTLPETPRHRRQSYRASREGEQLTLLDGPDLP